MQLNEGARIAPHLVLDRRLGVGGQGEVWRTRDERRDRWVALKILRPQPHWRALARFAQEARLLSMLDHPSLVRMLDFQLEGERAWLELELLDGETLRDVIVRHLARNVLVRLSWASQVIDQVCQALEYAHARQVVHRDLKPSNVVVSDGDPPDAKLIDLGIAKWLARDANQATTISHGFVGSMGYMAPEQITAGPITERTDVHQLGVLVYTLLAARLPWVEPGEHLEHLQAPLLAHRIATGPRPSLSRWRGDVPVAMDGVLARAMAIAPGDRYPTMGALREALARAVESMSQENLETVATTPEIPLSSLLDSDELAAILTARAVTEQPEVEEPEDPTHRIDEREIAGLLDAASQVPAYLPPDPAIVESSPSVLLARTELSARSTSLRAPALPGPTAIAPPPLPHRPPTTGPLFADTAPALPRPPSPLGPAPIVLARAPTMDRTKLAWPIAVAVWGLVALVYVLRLPAVSPAPDPKRIPPNTAPPSPRASEGARDTASSSVARSEPRPPTL